MKHIVTLSLVFFSLTHLAKAERVDGLRILTERYCNKTQTSTAVFTAQNQLDEQENPFFLSPSELTFIGIMPEVQASKYLAFNPIVADLTIRKKPKNNSP